MNENEKKIELLDEKLNTQGCEQVVILNERYTMWGHGYVNKHGVTVLSSRRKMDIDIAYAYRYIRDGWASAAQQGLLHLYKTYCGPCSSDCGVCGLYRSFSPES